MKVQELIKDAAIGDVRLAEIKILQPGNSEIIADTEDSWRVVPNLSGGGYFFDLAPHQIDLMLTYFGRVESAAGFGSNLSNSHQANDIVTGILKFDSGMHFSGTWAFNVDEAQKEDSCKIYGSKGLIEFSFYGDQVNLISDHSKSFKFSNPKAIQQPMIEQTVQYFLNQQEHNPCSIHEAAKVIDIMNIFAKQIK
jgi:predicted dehydrogenase